MKSASGKRPPDEAHGLPEKKLSSRTAPNAKRCFMLFQCSFEEGVRQRAGLVQHDDGADALLLQRLLQDELRLGLRAWLLCFFT